jgi:hypothetical protein
MRRIGRSSASAGTTTWISIGKHILTLKAGPR